MSYSTPTMCLSIGIHKQLYLENITDIKKQFPPAELTTAIIVELIKRKIDELQRRKKSLSLLQKPRFTDFYSQGTRE